MPRQSKQTENNGKPEDEEDEIIDLDKEENEEIEAEIKEMNAEKKRLQALAKKGD